jgi:hypothetical protein
METYRLLRRPTAKDLYSLWMERSSPYSLSIFISEDYYSSPRLTDNWDVIDFIAECVTRCKYLHLSGPRVCDGVPKQLACLNITIFPYLEGLFLSSGCFHSLKFDDTFSTLRFPNLRQLGISGAESGDVDQMVHLHNPLVTHLSCEKYLFERLRAVRPTEDFANLVELDVLLLWSLRNKKPPSPTPPKVVLKLPQLRILTISENFQLHQTAAFLRGICAPGVAVLKIVGDPLIPCDFLEPSQDFTFLEEFVNQSPGIQRLELAHNLFHCGNFMAPRSPLYQVPFIQLSITVRIRPWADSWTYHGETYKKKGLEVVYEMTHGESGLAQFFLTMLIGWSKEKTEQSVLGRTDVSAWKTSFWAGEAGNDYRRRRNQTLVRF